jgi:RimJ/RimL family protein N-acetyltransferase
MTLASHRLDLPPLTVAALDALIAGDRAALETATGARFPEPLAAPPLMEDALPFFRKQLVQDLDSAHWWARLLILRETGEAVGSAGFTGGPDGEGTVTLGYSVYPLYQRRGIAAEAAMALVEWALRQPGVHAVRATIPPDHIASRRVAAAAGLRRTARAAHDPDEGLVEIWERRG